MSRHFAASAVLTLAVACASQREIEPEAAGAAPGPESGVLGALVGPDGPQAIPSRGGDSDGTDGGAKPPPIILGALDKSIIDQTIRSELQDIGRCYRRRLRWDRALAGEVVVKFVIAKDGTVASSETESSTLPDPKVEACVHWVIYDLVFPEPAGGGIVIVSYPFRFSPE